MNNNINSISTLDRILKVGENDIKRCERKGNETGKLNIPESNTESLSSFEQEEKNKIEEGIKELFLETNEQISKLENKKEEIVRKLDIKIPKMQDASDEKHQTEVDNFTKILGNKSKDFQEVKLKYQEAQNELKSIKSSINNRPLNIQMVKYYIPFMFVLAIAELQINKPAFELFFEAKPIIAYLLALATGAVLIFFAHITGTAIKRAQSTEVEVNINKIYISIIALNLFVLLFIYYLSLMRQEWSALEDYAKQGGLGSTVGDLFDAEEATPGLDDVAPTNSILGGLLISGKLGKAGLFLLLQNIALYLCGFLAAFIRHDSHPDYEIAENKYNKLRKEFFKVQKEYDLKLAEIDKQQLEEQSNITKEREQSEEDLYEIDKEISSLQNIRSEYSKKASAVLTSRINAFRKTNLKSRNNSPPNYFKEKVKLNV